MWPTECGCWNQVLSLFTSLAILYKTQIQQKLEISSHICGATARSRIAQYWVPLWHRCTLGNFSILYRPFHWFCFSEFFYIIRQLKPVRKSRQTVAGRNYTVELHTSKLDLTMLLRIR